MEVCWALTPCGVRPSAPITPPLICKDMVGEEVWGKVHAAVGDSCSLAMALPRGIGFRGFRGSVWRPRPEHPPHTQQLEAHMHYAYIHQSKIYYITTKINILHSNVSKITLPKHKWEAKRLQLLEAEQKHQMYWELRLQYADGKPWGRSPSRWAPCCTGRAARGFSPMSPACWREQSSGSLQGQPSEGTRSVCVCVGVHSEVAQISHHSTSPLCTVQWVHLPHHSTPLKKYKPH